MHIFSEPRYTHWLDCTTGVNPSLRSAKELQWESSQEAKKNAMNARGRTQDQFRRGPPAIFHAGDSAESVIDDKALEKLRGPK